MSPSTPSFVIPVTADDIILNSALASAGNANQYVNDQLFKHAYATTANALNRSGSRSASPFITLSSISRPIARIAPSRSNVANASRVFAHVNRPRVVHVPRPPAASSPSLVASSNASASNDTALDTSAFCAQHTRARTSMGVSSSFASCSFTRAASRQNPPSGALHGGSNISGVVASAIASVAARGRPASARARVPSLRDDVSSRARALIARRRARAR